MPIDVTVPAGVAAVTKNRIELAAERAQTDLLDAISCIMASVDSDRKGYLLDCAEEFIWCAVGKLRLCAEESRKVPHR